MTFFASDQVIIFKQRGYLAPLFFEKSALREELGLCEGCSL
jgi:hypothetical protein